MYIYIYIHLLGCFDFIPRTFKNNFNNDRSLSVHGYFYSIPFSHFFLPIEMLFCVVRETK